MDVHPKCSSYFFTVTLLVALSVSPTTWSMKVILMYASCDDQLTYILHLMQRSIKPYFISNDTEHERTNFKNQEVFHSRHDLSDACIWVLQDTVAVIAISNETKKWEGIDIKSHDYNLPHLVSPNLCQCPSNSSRQNSKYKEYLEEAVFQFLRDQFLHYVIILHEEESTEGIFLGTLLTYDNIRVSHLRITAGHPNILKTVERFFDAMNMVDLSDDGRLLISLGGGSLADSLLKKLVEGSMHNTRTKILVFDSPGKWQKRLKNVKAYEVDLVVVSSDPLPIDDCPVAIEVLPLGTHDHNSQGPCRNLSSEYRKLGEAILQDFQSNFSKDCCPRSGMQEVFFTFWQSWPYENGTQNLKPEAIWSENLGLTRMMPIDFETITLRIAVLEYRPYVLLEPNSTKLMLKECVFKEIISFLSEKLNFKYKLVTPSENVWGTRQNGKTWNGAIGMVTRGEADIIPYLTSTPSRREVVDFSIPLAYVKYGMLVAFPNEPPRAFIFLKPFKREVWFLFIVTALVVSFILNKVHRWSCNFCKPEKKYVKGLATFFRCFWLIFGAMLNQGGIHLPVTNSARLVLASWWLAVLVVMATFSANLIAFLAFPEAKWLVKTLEDLITHKTIHMTISQDCPVLEDFNESTIEIYQRIRKVFLGNSKRGKVIKTKRNSVVDDVAVSKTVFIDDLNYLNHMVEEDYGTAGKCRLTISPNHFSKMDLALAFRRGSSLLSLVNAEVQQMQESGVLAHWKERFSPQRDECFDFDSLHGQSEITLEDLQGPFYLLAIGLIFAFLFLSWEFFWNKTKHIYRKCMKRKHSKRQTSTMHW